MDVRFFFAARYAEHVPDGTISTIGAGLESFQADAAPHLLPLFYLAAKVSFTREEALIPHTVKVRLVSPDGEPVKISDEILVTEAELPPNREWKGVILVLAINGLIIPSYGMHNFELVVDEAVVKKTPLRLEKVVQSNPIPPVV